MEKYLREAIKIRRHLHTIPETGFCEYLTSDFIFSYLKELGYDPVRISGTGVYVYVDNGKPSTALFRCDIDGLPISEETGLCYESSNVGRMHACGHDGHTAIMLVLAKYLKENEVSSGYNILLLFQPAEENPGGAKDIAQSGLFEKHNIVRSYALHLSPNHAFGKFHSKSGEFFASGVELYIDVHGYGAHGASPHLGNDAVLASCALVSTLHTIVSRNLNPVQDGVITIGTINGGSAMNAIAEKVSLSGTLRAFNDETKELLVNRVREVCKGIAVTYGVKVSFNPVYCYPPVINSSHLFNEAKEILGDRLDITDKVMMSEDFSYLSGKAPGFMMFLGTDDGKEQHRFPLHSPKFDFDDSVLIYGLKGFIDLIQNIK